MVKKGVNYNKVCCCHCGAVSKRTTQDNESLAGVGYSMKGEHSLY